MGPYWIKNNSNMVTQSHQGLAGGGGITKAFSVRKKSLLSPCSLGFKTFLDSGAKFGEMPDAPKLSRDVFWTYASNMNKIAPKVNTLEAVTRVGGTFVLDGDNVIYGWADKIPGDHPAPEDVLQESGILQA